MEERHEKGILAADHFLNLLAHILLRDKNRFLNMGFTLEEWEMLRDEQSRYLDAWGVLLPEERT